MLDKLKPPAGSRKRRKIIGRGRGSGHGKTSGRGHKGSWARASGGVRQGYEGGQTPLIRRVPKRGFTFTPTAKFEIVSIENLNRCQAGAIVTPEALYDKRLVRKKDAAIKILGDGELKHAVTVKAHAFSRSAAEKIQKAGGKTETFSVAPAATAKKPAAKKSPKAS